jgi:hypothetical protein
MLLQSWGCGAREDQARRLDPSTSSTCSRTTRNSPCAKRGLARGRPHELDALAQALGVQLDRARVAEWVVARAAQERLVGGLAPGLAHLGVVALPGNPPHEWTTCYDLGFGHLNLTNTQAYWIFELDYEPFGGSVVAIDLGVDYVPASDTLEGFLITNPPVDGFIPQMCMRYVER